MTTIIEDQRTTDVSRTAGTCWPSIGRTMVGCERAPGIASLIWVNISGGGCRVWTECLSPVPA